MLMHEVVLGRRTEPLLGEYKVVWEGMTRGFLKVKWL